MGLKTKDYGHLGLVASVCDEIKLVETIDTWVRSDEQRKVSVGLAVKAMVLNGLGFWHRTLYLTPRFFKDKPVDLLLGSGYVAADFNSHSLATALDRLHERGLTGLFFKISLTARRIYEVKTNSRHLDGTTFSLHSKQDVKEEERESGVIRLKRGYNKQNRIDIPQFILELIVSDQEGIPEFVDFADGNKVDKTEFPKVLHSYIKELKKAKQDWESGYYVADGALYSKENLLDLSIGIKWLTRVPRTIKECQQAVQLSWNGQKEWKVVPEQKGYYYQTRENNYGDVKQRWLVLYSDSSYKRASKAIENQVDKSSTSLEKGLNKVYKRTFKTAAAAKRGVKKWYKDLSAKEQQYHGLGIISIKENKRYGRGRRTEKTVPKSIDYQVEQVELKRNESAIEKAVAYKATFILASNEVDQAVLPASKLLSLYKDEQQKVERGFKFLKDPLFMLDKIFVQLPRRIMAIGMVMVICLLVYTLAQFQIRRSLAATGESLPNQLNRPTQRPTIRWVFMMMKGIHVCYRVGKEGVVRELANIEEEHLKIIRLMGGAAQRYYNVA